jgi:hypothetical protein
MLPLFPSTRCEIACLAVFLLSTPISVFAVYALEGDRTWWALFNTYSFSVAYVLLYLWPLLFERGQFGARLERATASWCVWLSCFTEITFQIPHNLLVDTLHKSQGSILEWPFFAYGHCDARWSTYTDKLWSARAVPGGVGLPPEVSFINWNDGILGLLVFGLLLASRRTVARNSSASQRESSRLLFVLALLFRDGTLFRENVEYMLKDHHLAGYPLTTGNPTYRVHGIACLWCASWRPPLTRPFPCYCMRFRAAHPVCAPMLIQADQWAVVHRAAADVCLGVAAAQRSGDQAKLMCNETRVT